MPDEAITLGPLTRAEAEAVCGGLEYVTGFYGPPPDPPTPAMTALDKISKALGRD